MPNQIQSTNVKRVYDLHDRTTKFGETMIDFLKTVEENIISRPLISQLIRSATSIGANYMEADCAESKKDFRHKISICKKEAKETTYWLQMLAKSCPSKIKICRELWKEAHELTLIFSAILNK